MSEPVERVILTRPRSASEETMSPEEVTIRPSGVEARMLPLSPVKAKTVPVEVSSSMSEPPALETMRLPAASTATP